MSIRVAAVAAIGPAARVHLVRGACSWASTGIMSEDLIAVNACSPKNDMMSYASVDGSFSSPATTEGCEHPVRVSQSFSEGDDAT